MQKMVLAWSHFCFNVSENDSKAERDSYFHTRDGHYVLIRLRNHVELNL